jgi:hypothetical protein
MSCSVRNNQIFGCIAHFDTFRNLYNQIVISDIPPTVPFAWLLLATTASLGISDQMRENYGGSEMLISEM